MDPNQSQTPDLGSVLSTLARYAPGPALKPSTSTAQAQEAQYGAAEAVPMVYPEEDEYNPSEPMISSTGAFSRDSSIPTIPLTTSASENEAYQRGPSKTDATLITDWSTGLRHVMKTVSRSDVTMARIQKMIAAQHGHETQWWAGRQELVERQKARVEGRKKLDDVLRQRSADIVDKYEDETRELIRYDAKVYRASVEMVKTMNGDSSTALGQRNSAAQARIEEKELLRLQKKMIELLEDLSKE